LGKIAEMEWIKTPELRPDMKLELGEFVVMPNHFHAIIIIGENKYNMKTDSKRVNKFAPQSNNLSSIIRGFKSSVTTNA
jgi:REP element-mobilizing transposase RayT